VLGNVYANANAYIGSSSIRKVTINTLSQLRRGVDGTGSANVYLANTRVVDSSLEQAVPDTATRLATVSGEFNAAANVTWRITLGGTISANVGEYLTQNANTANVRVLETVTNSNVVAVQFVAGNLTISSNVVTINKNGTWQDTDANVTAMGVLGQIKANGNVILSSTVIKRSDLWIPLGTGVGLEGSTLVPATFIKDEVSYIP
jgi:hypothetical protein